MLSLVTPGEYVILMLGLAVAIGVGVVSAIWYMIRK